MQSIYSCISNIYKTANIKMFINSKIEKYAIAHINCQQHICSVNDQVLIQTYQMRLERQISFNSNVSR